MTELSFSNTTSGAATSAVRFRGQRIDVSGGTLDLAGAGIEAISEIEGLHEIEGLKRLFLDGNDIAAIDGLDNLAELEVLGLGDNRISTIKGLANLGHLDALSLAGNRIGRMEAIEDMPSLRFLDLSRNMIRVTGGLHGLRSLEELRLSGNPIERLWGLHRAPRLRKIRLDGIPFDKMFVKGYGGLDDRGYARNPLAFQRLCKAREEQQNADIGKVQALLEGAHYIPVDYLAAAFRVKERDFAVRLLPAMLSRFHAVLEGYVLDVTGLDSPGFVDWLRDVYPALIFH
jgi:Leucine-rich repeat (LRR) protein